jgi:hypothetical protein
MVAHRSSTAPNARAARISGTAFAVTGAAAVVLGVASILVGIPSAAHDLVPLAGPGDVLGRFGQTAPVLAAALAAMVALAVAALLASRRLEPRAAAMELLILGLTVAVCIGGALGRVGHAADGGVMGATVVCLMGGMAVLAGGIVAVFGQE